MTYLHPQPLQFAARRLEDSVTIVTGASSGIGAAAVRRFAQEGARVVAAARRVELVEALACELREKGCEVRSQSCDVREEDSVRRLVDSTLDRYGRLDCAFNNAGVGGGRRALHELDVPRFDAVIATNLRGVFLCMKHEVAAMLAGGGGSIVVTSSVGGLIGAAGNSDYAASKWALAGLVKCAALDYARRGIRVNAIAPGPTESEMFSRWLPTEPARAALAEQMPMNYIAHPDDMARVALFLLSDESRWTTGAIVPCEGGRAAA
jgi:NAD(P)-dependent dehydrogenase (short-subunit alcohol dehydrogenase family)